MKKRDHATLVRLSREAKLNRVRVATAKRNAIRGYLAAKHGVSIRRIVLMDKAEKFVGRAFTGAYVIKIRHGRNLKIHF